MSKLLELYRTAERAGIEVDCFDLERRESLSIMDEDGDCYTSRRKHLQQFRPQSTDLRL